MTRIRKVDWNLVLAMLVIFGAMLLVTAWPAQATNSNQVDRWCEDGMKIEPVSTPFVVPEPPMGATWTLLVLKAGTENHTIANPTINVGYVHPNGKDISHVILCYTEGNTTTFTSTSTTTSTTVTIPSTTTTVPSTTTSSTVPDATTTTNPTSSSTTAPTTTVPESTTTEVPPPTYIESGDAGYLAEEHEGTDWGFGLAMLFFGAGLGILSVVAIEAWRKR